MNNNKKSTFISNKILVNDKEENNFEIIANSFHDYFVDIGKTISDSLLSCNQNYSEYLSASDTNSISLHPSDTNEVTIILKTLKRKSPKLWWNNSWYHYIIIANLHKCSHTCYKSVSYRRCISTRIKNC